MILVIGGSHQGKRDFVCEKYNITSERLHGSLVDEEGTYAVYDLQQIIRDNLDSDVKKIVMDYIESHPDVIIICNEIGNGLVPIDEKDRYYRDVTGEILIEIARRSAEVWRVICGTGQKIK
ncbi:MAG: bifunctional adenosylcobinamide kinase/adenosylcobinamide-phosphate guanylyltransferase [Lachnospiraceae bacterium]|nr:bifunctional adenosylcobinamide kinase/adenosylcobinamide-phosphate guanylyltransferase [Lachnospiraceae bacterium]